MKKIKIYIVDDHPIVFDGLKLLFEREHDIEACGTSMSAVDALRDLALMRPDIAIVDISLKGDTNGIELIRIIRERFPDILVLVLSMFDDPMYAERALRAGSRGYVVKHELTGTIITAVRHVLGGGIYVNHELATRIVGDIMLDRNMDIDNPMKKLSGRELDVFHLMGKGYRTTDIARDLHISIKTVDTYKQRMKEKLNIEDIHELVRIAIQWCK